MWGPSTDGPHTCLTCRCWLRLLFPLRRPWAEPHFLAPVALHSPTRSVAPWSAATGIGRVEAHDPGLRPPGEPRKRAACPARFTEDGLEAAIGRNASVAVNGRPFACAMGTDSDARTVPSGPTLNPAAAQRSARHINPRAGDQDRGPAKRFPARSRNARTAMSGAPQGTLIPGLGHSPAPPTRVWSGRPFNRVQPCGRETLVRVRVRTGVSPHPRRPATNKHDGKEPSACTRGRSRIDW